MAGPLVRCFPVEKGYQRRGGVGNEETGGAGRRRALGALFFLRGRAAERGRPRLYNTRRGSPEARPAGGNVVLNELIGQKVVIDLRSEYVCLGTLTRVDEHFLELKNADLHD